jgi:glycosyltransferase involved in cell wall biosynthesis
LTLLLDDRKAAKKMAESGRKLMVRFHDWDKISKQYERLLLDAVHG